MLHPVRSVGVQQSVVPVVLFASAKSQVSGFQHTRLGIVDSGNIIHRADDEKLGCVSLSKITLQRSWYTYHRDSMPGRISQRPRNDTYA